MINNIKNLKLAIIGLGYVGLPLALEFSKRRKVIGFDSNKKRVDELKSGIDTNLETTKKRLKNSKQLKFTNNVEDLKSINCYIITVPTPINKFKKPDLNHLWNVTKTVGGLIKKNDLIIYESTVYPGCTEEECVPILEKISGLKFNQDFFCGYSPERINPGDKEHIVSNIKKVTSGSTPKIAKLVDDLYNEIITVGTYKAANIKIAEAAKLIENTQRDLNIAFINELSVIFNKMNIDTQSVLEAASSKWNFLSFKPGIVGGHCIGVDPYYLIHKSKIVGYKPKVILASRKMNEEMVKNITTRLIQEMNKKKIIVEKSSILIMGATYKENCADIRNSGIKKLILELKKFNCNVDVYDPWADSQKIEEEYGIIPKSTLKKNNYDAF